MKRVFYLIVLSLLFLFPAQLKAYYYFNDFNNMAAVNADFMTNFNYGRVGVHACTTNTAQVNVNSSRLQFSGIVNNGNVNYIGSWVGNMVKFTSRTFDVSKENPFGVELIRTIARMDPHNDSWNPESHRHLNAMSFWLFEETGLNNSSPDGSVYNNYILLYDMMRDVFNLFNPGDNQSKPFSTWGKYISSESRFDLSLTTRADDVQTFDITDNTNYTLEWCYDDSYGSGTYNGTTNFRSTNTNVIGMMMTHDGETVSFYVNPNYNSDLNNPYPNEYLLLGTASVGWTNNISFMFGQEEKRYDTEMVSFDFDSVTIRSVASNSYAEITPVEIVTNQQISFIMVISNEFTVNDSGISEIKIHKPTGYSVWDTASVRVYSDFGSGSASTNIPSLSEMSKITTGTLASDGQVLVKTNNQILKLQFCEGTPSSSVTNIINKATPDKKVEIHFQLTAPSTPDQNGSSFEVYLDCKKYSGSPYTRYATTGQMKSSSGDAVSIFSNNQLLVKVYENVQAVASISPNEIYEGTDNVFYYYLNTSSSNLGPYITRFEILIPTDFTITSADVSSLKIIDDTTNAYVTNNKVVINYLRDNSIFPAQSGQDRVTMNVTGTPDIDQATNIDWLSIVYSTVPGTTPVYTITNSTFPKQYVYVRLQPPDAEAYISPAVVYNNTKNNTFQYVVRNNGDPGNNIQKIKIILPSAFTNADNFDSNIGNSSCFTASFGATNYILVNYTNASTNLGGGQEDILTFRLYDTIASLSLPTNLSFPSYADNNNGDGYVAIVEHPNQWDVNVISPDPDGSGSVLVLTNNAFTTNEKIIYTSDLSNSFKFKVYNSATADSENDIKLARITVPTAFTQIYNISSTKIINDSQDIKLTNNMILLYYTNMANGNLIPGEIDNVSFKLKDNITSPGTNTFVLEVANGKNSWALYGTGNFGAENKFIYTEYPPLNAIGFVRVDLNVDNIIDSSTMTNALTYYVTNHGDVGNNIRELRIYLPSNGSVSECINVDSQIVTNSLNERWVGAGDYIFIDYASDGNLLMGKTNDVITFQMVDAITINTSFQIPVEARNDRETAYLPKVSGRTQWVFVQVPPAYGRGRVYPTSIFVVQSGVTKTNQLNYDVENYGLGSNNLDRVRIKIPSVFSGKVQNISSTYLTNDGTSITVDANYIYLNYTNENNPLITGTNDTVTFEVLNTETNTGIYGWPVDVDNSDGNGYVDGSEISGGTTNINIIRRAYAALSEEFNNYPNSVDIYSSVSSSTLYYKFTHTGGNLSIRRSKILIPDPFITNNLSVNPNFSGTVGATYTISNLSGDDWIMIDYPNGDFSTDEENIVKIIVQDNWTVGETNVDWTSSVDYFDGNDFNSTIIASTNTVTVQFISPPISIKAYSSPNNIKIDQESGNYYITITNSDPVANDVLMAKIDMPGSLTNISFVTSQLIGTNIIYNQSDNSLLLNYAQYSTNLSINEKDIIILTGWDNITNAITNQFTLSAANSTNTNNLSSVSVEIGKSLNLNFYKPNYKTSVYIEPNSINTTSESNLYSFYIINSGSGSNYIHRVRIYIQTNYFITNSLNVSSSFNPDVTIYPDSILLDYKANSTNIKPGEVDTISLGLKDKLQYGNAVSTFNSIVRYSTSFSNYKTTRILTGKSINVSFVMPYPQADLINFFPLEIPQTLNRFTMNFDITNTGSGSNDLFKVIFSIPGTFTNGFSTNLLTSSKAYQKYYNSGTVSLSYTNFIKNQTDNITLSLSNTSPMSNYTVQVIVSNSSYRSNLYKSFGVVTVPSVYVEPNFVYATAYSNSFDFYVLNNGSGTSNIKSVKIFFPGLITNICSLNSTKIADYGNITTNYITNYLFIDYEADGNEIGSGFFDKLTLMTKDSIDYGYSNVSWRCLINTGLGLVDSTLELNKSLDVVYGMPSIDANAYVLPSKVLTSDETNRVTFTLLNHSASENSILRAKIFLSSLITNIAYITNNFDSVNSYNSTSNFIFLDYNSDRLKGGQQDQIEFVMSKILSTATNLLFNVYVDNGNTNGYVQIDKEPGKSLTIKVSFPPGSAKTYLLTSEIYTINSNSTIEYKIVNGADDKKIKKVDIQFNTNILRVTNIESVYLSGLYATNIIVTSNLISVIYSNKNDGLPESPQDDTITIGVFRKFENTSCITMSSIVLIGGTNKAGYVPPGQTEVLSITKAPYGRINGLVFPLHQSIRVKIYDVNANIIQYNYDGQELSTFNNQNTGYYMLDKVLPGTYRLYFESDNLKPYNYNFSIVSNQIIRVNDIGMSNALLSADAIANQSAQSYSDYKSYIQLPPGSFERDFSIDIFIVSLGNSEYAEHLSAYRTSPYIRKASGSGVYMYKICMHDINGDLLDGVSLLKDGTIKLYYDETIIQNAGWTENNLGIFYYKDSTKKWIPIGGSVDSVNNNITAHINYVSSYFGVFEKSDVNSKGIIKNIIVSTRVFTPGRGNDNFNMVRFNFSIERPVDKYSVKIYDLKGRLLQTIERSGQYQQGNVIWNGEDKDGVVVKSGVYIYKIEVEGEVYKGTIMVVK